MSLGLVTWHDEVDSTSDEVAAALRAGAADGVAIAARRQRAGRGRRGNSWRSPEGGLYLSVGLRGAGMRPLLTRLPLAVAVALAEELASEARIALKWPNDLWIDGRKCGGILCEAVFVGTELRGAVVGVGLNLGHGSLGERADAEEAADDSALADAAWLDVGEGDRREELALRCRAAICRARDELLDDPSGVLERWRGRDALRGLQVRAKGADGEEIHGIADGIADDGGLRLVDARGDVHVIRSGEVYHVRTA